MKNQNHFICFAWLLLLLPSMAYAQSNPRNFFIAHDLDSAGYEWTAMARDWNGSLVVSTVGESSSGPAFGPLRLRTHSNISRGQTPSSTTLMSAGNFRVFDMLGEQVIWLTGAYKGTSYLGNDTLVGASAQNLNPFIAQFDPNTNSYTWVWHASLPGDHHFQKLRQGKTDELLACGLASDSMGWLAAFNQFTGQQLWEKKFPGVRTISDARPFPNDTTSYLVTGTMPDTGNIFQVPAPLHGTLTGYRNFLARLFPANDSVVFLRTEPGFAFDFEPVIILGMPGTPAFFVWSTPTTNNGGVGRSQVRWAISAEMMVDSVVHDFFYQEIEEETGAWQSENMAFFKTPGFNPNLFDLRSTSGPYTIGQYAFSQGTQPPFLTNLYAATLSMAFKSTGSVDVDMQGWSFWRDSTLSFPNASPSQPKWVLLTTGFIVSSVPEKSAVQFTVYPNPVSQGQFKIQSELGFDQPAAWTLRDVQGRMVRQGQLADVGEPISVVGLDEGLYFFELETSKGRGVQKLMISAR